jgi:c-di-GMP-binding flagellar brake protein YcgR
MFLEIEKGCSTVIIDTVLPKHGNQHIESSKSIRVEYKIDGVLHYFDTRFIRMVEGRLPSIKIAFPSSVKKVQKRKFFRVSPSVDNPIIVEVKEGFVEKVGDISENGLTFFTRRSDKEIKIEMVFERMKFSLPKADKEIIAKVLVRCFTKGSELKNRCGVEFINISLQDKDSLAQYVTVRQRELISNIR